MTATQKVDNRPLAPASDDFIRMVFSHSLGASVAKIEAITGQGECNNVFSVRTSSGEFILRTNTSAEGLSGYEKEAWCLEKTSSFIPGPSVLGLGSEDGTAWMIENRIQGAVGSSLRKDPLQPASSKELSVWRQLGTYAARLQDIQIEGFGFFMKSGNPGVFRNSWLEMVDYYIGEIFENDNRIDTDILTAKQIELARERLEYLKSWNFSPSLAHANFALKNTILAENGTLYVIDWGSAESTRGLHLDMAEIVTWWGFDSTIHRAFLEGCGISRTDYARIQEDVDTLVLLRSLDAIVWARANKKTRLREYAKTACKNMNRIFSA